MSLVQTAAGVVVIRVVVSARVVLTLVVSMDVVVVNADVEPVVV